jgi:hypothetical protein
VKNSRLVVLGLAVIVGLTQGCETRSCPAVGWSEGLTVDVTSTKPLTGGTFRFVVEIPGQTFDVNLVLEDPKNTQQGVLVSQHIERDTWQLNASLTGFIQNGNYSTTGDIAIGRYKGQSGGPEWLNLTAFQDDAQIGSLELDAIEYHKDQINGPGCGVATTAVASISITPVE